MHRKEMAPFYLLIYILEIFMINDNESCTQVFRICFCFSHWPFRLQLIIYNTILLFFVYFASKSRNSIPSSNGVPKSENCNYILYSFPCQMQTQENKVFEDNFILKKNIILIFFQSNIFLKCV